MADMIEIPAQNFEALQAELEKLNKRCQRITGKKIHIMPIGNREVKDEAGRIAKVLEIYVSAPEMKISGWEFVGRIDHRTFSETHRNVVFMNPAITDVPNTYWETPSHCEHCEEDRRRNFTFILRNEAGELKQVGSSCLKDFLGHDPIKTLKAFDYLEEAIKRLRGARRELEPNDFFYINTQQYVGLVIDDIKAHGWLGSQKARELQEQGKQVSATWSNAYDMMFGLGHKYATAPTEASYAEAEAIIAEVAASEPVSDLDRNLQTIALSTSIDGKMARYAAVIGYKWFAKQPKPNKDTSNSQHFLNVGDKFVGEVLVLNKRLVEGFYGTSTMVRMLHNGNVLVTFASGSFDPDVNATISIKGTVKANDTFNGVKQTILTRVRNG